MTLTLLPPNSRGNKFWMVYGRVAGKVVSRSTGETDRAAAAAWVRRYMNPTGIILDHRHEPPRMIFKFALSPQPPPIPIGVAQDLIDKIDAWRTCQPTSLSRSAAVDHILRSWAA
jgi:hypothetical protein